MPDKGDFGLSELHETIRGGERVLIRRRARPENMALYICAPFMAAYRTRQTSSAIGRRTDLKRPDRRDSVRSSIR